MVNDVKKSFREYPPKHDSIPELPRHSPNCNACGAPKEITFSLNPRIRDFENIWCAKCAGNSAGIPGIDEPKIGELWQERVKGPIRITQEYQGGTFGGLAQGVNLKTGQTFGLRRGSVERGLWTKIQPTAWEALLVEDL
jgi:hypothetical protein